MTASTRNSNFRQILPKMFLKKPSTIFILYYIIIIYFISTYTHVTHERPFVFLTVFHIFPLLFYNRYGDLFSLSLSLFLSLLLIIILITSSSLTNNNNTEESVSTILLLLPYYYLLLYTLFTFFYILFLLVQQVVTLYSLSVCEYLCF